MSESAKAPGGGGDGLEVTITSEAAAWLASRPAALMTRDGIAIIVLGKGHLAALGRLLARAVPETVLTGADHELFAALAEAARSAP